MKKYNLFLIKLITLSCFLLFNPVYAIDQETYPFTSNMDAVRFQSLTKEIRCVVCQNQNIADSNAPLANDLREKVYRMILDKQSNDEIKLYLTKRYGEYILLEPRLNKLTFLLWGFPIFGLFFILLILYRYKKTQTKICYDK